MNKKDLDLSAYRDSETLAPSFSTKTKLQILKNYLAAKEQHYKNIADNTGVTSVLTGIMSPLTAVAIASASVSNPGFLEYPPTVALGATAIAGAVTSVVTYVISKKAREKQGDYKYLKECSEAGIKDNQTLEKARNYLNGDYKGQYPLKDIKDIICPRPPQYINPDHFTASEEELGL